MNTRKRHKLPILKTREARAVGGNPKNVIGILEDSSYSSQVFAGIILCNVISELTVFQAGNSNCGRHPEGALIVFDDGPHIALGESIFLREEFGFAVAEPGYALKVAVANP